MTFMIFSLMNSVLKEGKISNNFAHAQAACKAFFSMKAGEGGYSYSIETKLFHLRAVLCVCFDSFAHKQNDGLTTNEAT